MTLKFPYQLAPGDIIKEGTVQGVRWVHKEKQFEIRTNLGQIVWRPIIKQIEIQERPKRTIIKEASRGVLSPSKGECLVATRKGNPPAFLKLPQPKGACDDSKD